MWLSKGIRAKMGWSGKWTSRPTIAVAVKVVSLELLHLKASYCEMRKEQYMDEYGWLAPARTARVLNRPLALCN